jgi:hypothetical protein
VSAAPPPSTSASATQVPVAADAIAKLQEDGDLHPANFDRQPRRLDGVYVSTKTREIGAYTGDFGFAPSPRPSRFGVPAGDAVVAAGDEPFQLGRLDVALTLLGPGAARVEGAALGRIERARRLALEHESLLAVRAERLAAVPRVVAE